MYPQQFPYQENQIYMPVPNPDMERYMAAQMMN